jgi:hypothetical protein
MGRECSKREARVPELVAKIAPDVRERILKLYREGRRIEAYPEYERASGEDLATARTVVETLAGEPR